MPGRLTRLKGHEEFIELLARLKAAGLDVHGLIVGGEDPRRRAYAAELHHAVAARGLGGHITFTGQRDDMREIYAASNLVLSLSTQPESFGRTVLEAISIGVPVLCYDHGGVGEICKTLFPAGLVAVGNRDALIARVEQFHSKAPDMPPVHPFLLRNMLEGTVAIYQELINE